MRDALTGIRDSGRAQEVHAGLVRPGGTNVGLVGRT